MMTPVLLKLKSGEAVIALLRGVDTYTTLTDEIKVYMISHAFLVVCDFLEHRIVSLWLPLNDYEEIIPVDRNHVLLYLEKDRMEYWLLERFKDMLKDGGVNINELT